MPYVNDKIEPIVPSSKKKNKGLTISAGVVAVVALVFCLVLNLAETSGVAFKVFAGLSIALPLMAVALSAICIVLAKKGKKGALAIALPILIIVCSVSILAGGIYGYIVNKPTTNEGPEPPDTPSDDEDGDTDDIRLTSDMTIDEIKTVLNEVRNFTICMTGADVTGYFYVCNNGYSFCSKDVNNTEFFEGSRIYKISISDKNCAIGITDYSGYEYDFSPLNKTVAEFIFNFCLISEEYISVDDDGKLICDNETNYVEFYDFGKTSLAVPDEYKDYASMAENVPAIQTQVTSNYTCSVIGAGAYLTKIEIPEVIDGKAVVKIAEDAFAGCFVESVTIPSGVATIEDRAFSRCYSLEKVVFAENSQLTSMGNGVFEYCSSLTDITLPSGLMSVGNDAFSYCESLTNITLPNSVTSIGERAFYECTSLASITMPNVTSIDMHAFGRCESLTSVAIPSVMTYIDGAAFYECSGLNVVTIPKSVDSIGPSAFASCENLKEIRYDGTESEWSAVQKYDNWSNGSDNFMIYFTTTPKQLSYALNSSGDGYVVVGIGDFAGSKLIIPETHCELPVVGIHDSAFEDCLSIISVTIPSGVTAIGDDAFKACYRLIEVCNKSELNVRLGDTNYGYVGYYAERVYEDEGDSWMTTDDDGFIIYQNGADKLVVGYTGEGTNVVLDGITGIRDYAFYERADLTGVTISDSVTDIGNYAFYGCSKLTSVVIPDSVTKIGVAAFSKCVRLTNVTIGSKVTYISYIAFEGCIKLVEVYNRSALSITAGSDTNGYVGYYAKNVCTENGGSKISFDEDNILIYYNDGSDKIFIGYDYSRLTDYTELDMTLPSEVTKIGSYAFYNDDFLTAITIPKSVTSIDKSAFYGCTELKTVTYKGTEAEWDNLLKAAQWDEGTANYTVHFKDLAYQLNDEGTAYTVTGIGTYESAELIIPATYKSLPVTAIADEAFFGCSGITSITIPDSVTSIGDVCTEFTSIYYTGDVAEWCGISGLKNIMSSTRTLYIGGNKVEGNLVIPDGVTSIGDYAFFWCKGLTSITIPDGVTSIGKDAFFACSALTNITIPDSVTSIGSGVFYGCTGLTSVMIGSGVTSIGESAFESCTGLASITIPNSVKSIGEFAFDYCTKLTEINYDGTRAQWNAITKGTGWDANTGDYTISYRTLNFQLNDEGTAYTVTGVFDLDATEIIIPATYENLPVTAIADEAFADNTTITSVTIPNSVTSIGNYAFEYCNGLTSVAIGSGVTSIGGYAFYNCYKLVEVYNKSSLTITAGNSGNGYVGYYAKAVYTKPYTSKLSTDEDGYIIYTDGDDKILIGYTGTETELSLPNGITEINQGAFYKRSGLKSITISDSVTSIGKCAFESCTGLTNITIPDSVTSIGNYAFYGCTGLTSVTIGSGVTNIYGVAFFNCIKLVEVYNKSSLTITAGSTDNGYVGCYAKAVYTEPYTSKLSTDSDGYIIYTDGDDKILIGYTGTETELSLPNGITEIYQYAFYNCTGLTSITIPDSVTSIGNYAFEYCNGLTSVAIGSGVTSIGKDAFFACSALTNITIPDSVTSIGDYAFYDCASLTSVTIGSGVTSIGERAFYGCRGLTSVTIPDSVTSIGNYAFYKCTRLTSVTIGNDVTSIGNYAFYGCTGLTSITIPDSVKYIGNRAFCNCTGLTSITMGSGVTRIGAYAFDGCNGLTSITFKDTTTWYRTTSSTNWENETGGTQTSVTSPSTNATYFTSTFYDYYWYKL